MFSIETKKNAINYAKKHNPLEAARVFNVPVKSVKRWIVIGAERK